MAYDKQLAVRVRQALTRRAILEERAMFGGVAFMVRGHAKAMEALEQGQGDQ